MGTDREFSQAELVGGIVGWLDEHGIKSMSPRQLNAVVAASDGIIAAIDQSDVLATNGMGLLAWLRSDDTGQSSLYMARELAVAAGLPSHHERILSPDPWPHDPSDFGRCVRLLDAAPELRPHIGLLKDKRHGPVWNAIAERWSELESLYCEESPSGQAPKLYAALQEVREVA